MKNRRGFTIIELLVVITIIAMLATLAIFSFGSWRARTARTEMKNELNAVTASLQNYLNFNNSYPPDTNSLSYQANPNVSLSYTRRSDGKSYCLSAANTTLPSERWYVDSVNGTMTTTACS